MRFGPPHSPPAYRFVVSVVHPLLTWLTKRAWSGAENLPRDRGFVAVSNHVSHIDPFIFGHFLNDAGIVPHYLGKVEVFKIPVVGAILRGADQIPVYRETGQASSAYSAAVDAIEDGKCVAIYPEGTVTREPDLWPMRGKTGAARVALATGCPVIPIAQWGAQEILAPYGRKPSLVPRHTMQVRAGEPVDLSDLQGVEVTADVLADATERIMAALATELEHLRGEQAPPGRYDPRDHGITVTGRPWAATPPERLSPREREQPRQWADDHPEQPEQPEHRDGHPDDVEDQA